MTDEQIVEAAKSAEKKTGFGRLVHSKVSKGVNSAYGTGFLDGAEWARERMLKNAMDGCIINDGGEYQLIIPALRTILSKMDEGDKVRIIIVKEEN